jgi:hypothetical protein
MDFKSLPITTMTTVTSEQLKAQAQKILDQAKELESKERQEKVRKEGEAAFLRGFSAMKDGKADAAILFPCPSSIGLPYNQASVLRSVTGSAGLDKLSLSMLGSVRFWDIVTDLIANGFYRDESKRALQIAEKIYASGYLDYLSVVASRFPKN